VLQEVFLQIIEILKSKFEKDLNAFKLILLVIHASLAEAFQVGRCDEQVAVAFSQFLLSEEKINFEWFQARNPDKPGGHNFLVLNRNPQFLGCEAKPNERPEAWQEGWVLDPMDSRVDKLNEITAAKLMGHLARIVSEPDSERIKLKHYIGMRLPLNANHHEILITKLGQVKQILNSLLEQSWDEVWNKINAVLHNEHSVSENLSCQIEGQAKVWIKAFFDILDTKIQAHQEIKAQLAMHNEGLEAGANAEFIQKVQSLRLN
jgi:hypothetical protein